MSEGDLVGAEPHQPTDAPPACLGWMASMMGARRTDDLLTCVGLGIDSLYLCVDAQLAPACLDRLLELNRLARERQGTGDPVMLYGGGRQWEVTWARAPWALRLEAPAVASIKVARSSNSNGPQVYIEIRAKALWQYGAQVIADELVSMIRGWEVPREEPTRVTVSRLDLAADFLGFDLTGAELPERRWVGQPEARSIYWRAGKARADDPELAGRRRRRRGKYDDPAWDRSPEQNKARAAEVRRLIEERKDRERDRVGALYYRGQTYTGGAFGTGTTRSRHYRKDIELKTKAGGRWIEQIWRWAGWDGKAPVMRVEMQLRGPALRRIIGTAPGETIVNDRGPGRVWFDGKLVTVGNDLSTTLRHLPALWRRVHGEPGGKGWLTLRTPTGAREPWRWPIDPRWAFVQAVDWEPVVQGYGLNAVKLATLRHQPTQQHFVGKGFQPDPHPWVGDRGDIAAVQAAICGPDAMRDWGEGLRTASAALIFSATCDHALARHIEVESAEQKRDALVPGLIGMLATFAATHAIATKAAHDPAAARREALEVLTAAAAEDETVWRTKVQAARQRHAMRGAVSWRAQRLHQDGQMQLALGAA